MTTLYFADGAAAHDALETFLTGLASYLPDTVSVQAQAGGDVIEDTSGALTAVWAGTATDPHPGVGGTLPYAAPTGILLRWETLAIRAGSRLRGRSYIVPVVGNAFSASGSLTAQTMSDLGGLAAQLIGAVTPNMLVWQRPRKATAAYTDGRGIPHKALSGRLGSSAVVVTSSIPNEAVVLRSRRD